MRISDWSSDVCSSDLPYGIANRNTKLQGHASVAWLFGAAQDSKLQRTPPRSPLVDEIHRHAESLIDFGSTDKRSRAPHTTQISLVDEFLDRLPDSHAANAELFTEFLVRMEPFAVFLPTQNHRQDSSSEEHTSELQSLMRSSYAVFCL